MIDGLGTVAYLELAVNILTVFLYRIDGYGQVMSDLFVQKSFCQCSQYFLFPFGECLSGSSHCFDN